MAKDYKTIIKITDEEKNKIIDNSPKNLPLNPSAQGYSGAEIRKRLYQSTVGEDGSLLALLERLVDVLTTELNAIETDKADVSYADSGLSLKADKTYVDSKLGLKTDKTYVDTELDKKVDKTVYELAINDLENNKLSVITFNSEKNTMTVYVDTKANTAKSEAQSYADTKDASVLLEAKAYTDTKNDRTYIDAQDSTTLNQAKSYTDGKIDSLIANAPATYDTLKEIADYIASDQTFSQSILLEIAGLKTDKVAVSVYNSKIASIESNITTLQSGKADISHNHDTVYADIDHNHPISEVTGLQAALDNKAASNHNHDTVYAEIDHNHDTVYADIEHTHVGSQIYVKSEELGTMLNDWATSIENELSDIKQEVEDAFDELATLMEGV